MSIASVLLSFEFKVNSGMLGKPLACAALWDRSLAFRSSTPRLASLPSALSESALSLPAGRQRRLAAVAH